MRTLFICFLLFLSTNITAGSIYKCKQGDSYVFSQLPCGNNGEEIAVEQPQSFSTSDNFQASSPHKPQQPSTKNYILAQKKKQLQRKINALYKKRKTHLAKYNKDQIVLGDEKSDIYYERSVFKKIMSELKLIDKQIEKEKQNLITLEKQIEQSK